MKRKPHLYKLTFRASLEVRTWLDDQARELMKEIGIRTLTEARGLVLTALAGAQRAYAQGRGPETFKGAAAPPALEKLPLA